MPPSKRRRASSSDEPASEQESAERQATLVGNLESATRRSPGWRSSGARASFVTSPSVSVLPSSRLITSCSRPAATCWRHCAMASASPIRP
eukprot:1614529-Prymnesium_polylepis.1